MTTWFGHLTRHINSSEQFYKAMYSDHLKNTTTLRLTIYAQYQTYAWYQTYIRYHLINTLYLVRNLTSSGGRWLELTNFIFYSMMVVLEHVKLVLPSSAGAYQTYTVNESYRIGGDNTGAWITSHCLALWSLLETWWGDWHTKAWFLMKHQLHWKQID